ncbi:type II toxin-antitoxin system YafQ family toxin [Candidatus Parcubacteria bacterium]|nr:type II toxin-antitoxin system YafQ family toxin [Candidatus Parcubacteria bacterium]
MYSVKYSSKFKKDIKKINNPPIKKSQKIIDLLIAGKKLDRNHQNHKLQGEFKNCYECHISPDILLIYKVKKQELLILLLRIGSHSELF